MSSDNLFGEGDPFDHPAWKEAEKTSKKTKRQASDFVGCPMAWLERVLPHIRGGSQIIVALLLYRRWVAVWSAPDVRFPQR
jgi:hypothetical protein